MPKINLRQWIIGACALGSFVLSYLSYEHLPLAMFYRGMSRFYDIVPTTVPEECKDMVGYAAAAFAGIYDYVALATAAAFLILALFLTWRFFASRTT